MFEFLHFFNFLFHFLFFNFFAIFSNFWSISSETKCIQLMVYLVHFSKCYNQLFIIDIFNLRNHLFFFLIRLLSICKVCFPKKNQLRDIIVFNLTFQDLCRCSVSKFVPLVLFCSLVSFFYETHIIALTDVILFKANGTKNLIFEILFYGIGNTELRKI